MGRWPEGRASPGITRRPQVWSDCQFWVFWSAQPVCLRLQNLPSSWPSCHLCSSRGGLWAGARSVAPSSVGRLHTPLQGSSPRLCPTAAPEQDGGRAPGPCRAGNRPHVYPSWVRPCLCLSLSTLLTHPWGCALRGTGFDDHLTRVVSTPSWPLRTPGRGGRGGSRNATPSRVPPGGVARFRAATPQPPR